MPGVSVQLYQTLGATADSTGNCTMKINGPGFGRTWQGTVTILGSPQGTEWTISIGAQSFGQIYAPGPAGPYQLLTGQTLQLSASGLAVGTKCTAIFSGVDDPKEAATPYTGPTITTSVTLGGP